jgi:ABC-type molybdate transport system substrate-binding protein
MHPFISKRLFLPILIATGLVFSVIAATAAEKVIIFHAGSLTVPLAKIEKAFEAAHPGIDVLREAGGSTKMARMISELGKPADIMASADYKVIDKTLIPTGTPIGTSASPPTSWCSATRTRAVTPTRSMRTTGPTS